MKEVGKRLKTPREGFGFSQAKLAEKLHSTQSSINLYENGQSAPTVALLCCYADYFDVSMDYIFTRMDKPQGQLYEFNPQTAPNKKQMRDFIEKCFDPQSPMSSKLKESLYHMM